jgi:iron complex transport system permease protein
MAGPYVLGTKLRASLGVAFVIMGLSAQYSPGALRIWVTGPGGCRLRRRRCRYDAYNVYLGKDKGYSDCLIIGMMLSGGISAIVSIMQYFSTESLLKSYAYGPWEAWATYRFLRSRFF